MNTNPERFFKGFLPRLTSISIECIWYSVRNISGVLGGFADDSVVNLLLCTPASSVPIASLLPRFWFASLSSEKNQSISNIDAPTSWGSTAINLTSPVPFVFR